MNRISVIGKIVMSEAQRERLVELGARYIANSNPDRRDTNEISSRIGDAEIALNNISTPITSEILALCPRLKFIQTWSTGTDNIDLNEAKRRGIRVANVPDFSTEAVAEKTLGLMILAANRFPEANAHALAGGWDYQKFCGRELRGKTLCLVGSGRIGKRVEELAKAFGMKVIVIGSRSSKQDLNTALKNSQFISLHCPLNEKTRYLIGAEQFAAMNQAILINTSRGGIVDEVELVKAIKNQQVRFAALDVLEQEPPHKEHPLLHLDCIYITPHLAWNTEESLSALTDRAISNIELFLKNQLCDFIV